MSKKSKIRRLKADIKDAQYRLDLLPTTHDAYWIRLERREAEREIKEAQQELIELLENEGE